MKSFFRIYAKTSKGNDNHLLKELKSFNLNPRYDQHLNSFYFNSTWKDLFNISFHSLTVQQMYIQIGQNFRIIDEQQIKTELERLPFKNYIPIQRGLIESTTLKILTRESVHLPSQNVLINLITSNLNKEITKKEYFKQIQSQKTQNKLITQREQKEFLELKKQRKNDISYYDIKEAVQRKWWQEDQQKDHKRQQRILQLQRQLQKESHKHKKLLFQHNQEINKSGNQKSLKSLIISPLIEQSQKLLIQIKSQLNEVKNFSTQNYLSKQLAYHPHLIFYIRKNKGRFLLKINKDNLYKHGWKNKVNWGPIRESIAASILHQSKILEQEQQNKKSLKQQQDTREKSKSTQKRMIKIWDPMCGSGTFGLVAATMIQKVPVRSEVQKQFEWVHWPIYKSEYLSRYWKQEQAQKKNRKFDYKLVISDKDRQTINYSIDNFRLLLQGIEKHKPNEFNPDTHQLNTIEKCQNKNNQSKLFPSKTPTSQVLQLIPDKIGFACGDFQTVMQLLKNSSANNSNDKLTIVTNLPYLHGRSQSKYPLSQLTSIYSRFSQMINSNKNFIDNVFIIIDKNINDKRHFLNVSSLQWSLIGQYNSGGMEIGLYAWNQNKIKSKFDQEYHTQLNQNPLVEYQKIKGQLSSEDRQLILNKQKNVANALVQLRKKLSQIDRKYYNLPKHLVRDAHGWKRVLQKRRKRHLQSAYELFARKRDKLIALKQYAREKLQLKMLRRGTVWKNKNLRFFDFSQEKLEQYSEQIKKVFQQKIEQALKKKQTLQEKKKLKIGDKIETMKIRNKWNNDERRLVKQIKNSKGSQTLGRKQSSSKKTSKLSHNHKR